MGRLKAVCWDFDGVIADTENAHVAAWERTFAEMGIDVAAEVCARAAEEDDRAFLAEVFAKSNVPNGDVEGWTRRKQSLTESILAEDLSRGDRDDRSIGFRRDSVGDRHDHLARERVDRARRGGTRGSF